MTAAVVWEYRHVLSIFTPTVGSQPKNADWNTGIGLGKAGAMTEVDPNGSVVWKGYLRVTSQPTDPFYRGQNLR
jgi:hypothetical protein